MSQCKQFLNKVLRIRKRLVHDGKCKKNVTRLLHLSTKIEQYLQFYPKASEAAMRKWMRKHEAEILELIPGNKAGDSMKKEFFNLIES
jgi:hypothetical protein